MPKNPSQDKETMAEKGSSPTYKRARIARRVPPQTLAGIMKDQGWLKGLAQVRHDQQQWLAWFEQILPEELRGSIVNVVRKGPELTVLAASAGWSARLRYALESLQPQLKERAPDIVKVRVRVTPAGPKG
jgi:hypothetical protein